MCDLAAISFAALNVSFRVVAFHLVPTGERNPGIPSAYWDIPAFRPVPLAGL